ncbi:MAG: L-aspartate oxidase, partial [Xanthobacteraceae bacterium]|nr:L-aspartate oxidase [Xanthobacteraceae bacterium]
LHGANRLASNSLLEAAVFGARVADSIAGTSAPPRQLMLGPAPTRPVHNLPAPRRRAIVTELRRTMAQNVGVVRSATSLETALRDLARLRGVAIGDAHVSAMVETACFVAGMALLREESRGGHYRSDFPAPKPALAKRSLIDAVALEANIARFAATQQPATAAG